MGSGRAYESSGYTTREATEYMAHQTRKGQPPHFRPIMIIVVVLSLGTAICGLVLTIVAYRPGHSSVGYDPLKIVGPILLGVGAAVFAICIFDICRRISRDKRRLEKSYAAIQAAGPSQMSARQQYELNASMQYAPRQPQSSHHGTGSTRHTSQSTVQQQSEPQQAAQVAL